MNMFTKTVASLAFASGLGFSNAAMAVDFGDLSFLVEIANAGVDTPVVQVPVEGSNQPIVYQSTKDPAKISKEIGSPQN